MRNESECYTQRDEMTLLSQKCVLKIIKKKKKANFLMKHIYRTVVKILSNELGGTTQNATQRDKTALFKNVCWMVQEQTCLLKIIIIKR